MEKNSYDYIIAGMGCSGLSLAVHMIRSGAFDEMKILLLDQDQKKKNDRTWCFWETGAGLFEPIVNRRWEKAWFHSDTGSQLLNLSPYEYKLIRGIDFYQYCFDLIKAHSNFDIRFAQILDIRNEGDQATVETANGKYAAQYVFSSIPFELPTSKNGKPSLIQHFKGWLIETEETAFQSSEATIMDFRVPQDEGTTFIYTLPFSDNRALVEYTLFSDRLLEPEAYDQGLKNYIRRFITKEPYMILEQEFGVIPMITNSFANDKGGLIHIGTAGGQTKPSTGYTFQFIQKHSEAIVRELQKSGEPFTAATPGRFNFYDNVLLKILARKKLGGDEIFSRLFRRNKPRDLFRFLDNESTLFGELKIISSLPTIPFIKAAIS